MGQVIDPDNPSQFRTGQQRVSYIIQKVKACNVLYQVMLFLWQVQEANVQEDAKKVQEIGTCVSS